MAGTRESHSGNEEKRLASVSHLTPPSPASSYSLSPNASSWTSQYNASKFPKPFATEGGTDIWNSAHIENPQSQWPTDTRPPLTCEGVAATQVFLISIADTVKKYAQMRRAVYPYDPSEILVQDTEFSTGTTASDLLGRADEMMNTLRVCDEEIRASHNRKVPSIEVEDKYRQLQYLGMDPPCSTPGHGSYDETVGSTFGSPSQSSPSDPGYKKLWQNYLKSSENTSNREYRSARARN